jgi:hypothetical protein
MSKEKFPLTEVIRVVWFISKISKVMAPAMV